MSRKDYKQWAKELSQSLDTDKALILCIDDMGEYWGGLKAILEHAPERACDYIDAGLEIQNDDQYRRAAVSGLLEKREVIVNSVATNHLLEKLRNQFSDQPGRYQAALRSILSDAISLFERQDFREVISMLIDKHGLAEGKYFSQWNTQCSAIGAVAQTLAYDDHTVHKSISTTTGKEAAILLKNLTHWKDNARDLVNTLLEKQKSDKDETFLEQELIQLCMAYHSWGPPVEYAGIDLLLDAGARWEGLVEQHEDHPEYQVLLTRPAVVKHRLEKIAGVIVEKSIWPKPKF